MKVRNCKAFFFMVNFEFLQSCPIFKGLDRNPLHMQSCNKCKKLAKLFVNSNFHVNVYVNVVYQSSQYLILYKSRQRSATVKSQKQRGKASEGLDKRLSTNGSKDLKDLKDLDVDYLLLSAQTFTSSFNWVHTYFFSSGTCPFLPVICVFRAKLSREFCRVKVQYCRQHARGGGGDVVYPNIATNLSWRTVDSPFLLDFT